MSLEHIKAIITADYVLVVNPDDENVDTLVGGLRAKFTSAQVGRGGGGRAGGCIYTGG